MSPVIDPVSQRSALIERSSASGREFANELAQITDSWLSTLHDAAREQHPRAPRTALLAIGGYGRGELAPFSDLDLLLVHRSKPERIESVASAIWYPIWDSGCILGHAVRSVDEQMELSRRDLDTATSLLTARHIAGDARLASEVIEAGRTAWRRRRKQWFSELRDRVRARQTEAGDVAYMLEPDLKDGHGGLRDVHSLWWAQAGGMVIRGDDLEALDECYATLMRARVGLHRSAGRRGDVLRLEGQDAAAASAGYSDADEMMADISAAARTIAWLADENWGRLGRVGDGRPMVIAPGIDLVEGEIELAEGADPAGDPTLVLRVAQAAARNGARIGRRSLDLLTAEMPDWPETWPAGAVDDLVALLLEGHAAIPVLESLDQRALIERILPEWRPVRSRPQRNAYHRFTVDRHLWEAAANVSEFADRVQRPDLLVLGALFHDIGKGYPGDHTVVGMSLVRDHIGPRLGLGEADIDVLEAMVEHHLLIPDVAMRRDLSDPSTIAQVAEAVGDSIRLELLHGLTVGDSKATGPSAWGTWKEGLVNDLVKRVQHVLGGGEVTEVTWRLFPDAGTLERMATGETSVVTEDDRVTVVTPDIPGAFSRVAGVLSLHGLDVASAQAHSDEPQAGRPAMAASQFLVIRPREGIDWSPVIEDLNRALRGQLAIEARLVERARTYRRRRATQAQLPGEPRVVFHDGASSNATVIEVHCVSKVGVLHRITKALAEVDLDIRHATVQTIGMEVVDTFYVRTRAGTLLDDSFHREEVRRAVLHVVG